MSQEEKRITANDLTILREELELSTMDLFWLYGVFGRNLRYTKDEGKKPIKNVPVSLLTRYLSHHPDKNPIPKMPSYDEVFDALLENYEGKLSNRKAGTLFGSTGWSGYRWAHGGNPSPTVERLFYILLNAIREEGSKALYDYLEVLDQEAYARGFEDGFKEVLQQGTWHADNEEEESETDDFAQIV